MTPCSDSSCKWYLPPPRPFPSPPRPFRSLRTSLSDCRYQCSITNPDALTLVAGMLDVDPQLLTEALTCRKSVTRGEVFTTPFNMEQAVDARDAMAKALYDSLFNWLVTRINRVLFPPKSKNKANTL